MKCFVIHFPPQTISHKFSLILYLISWDSSFFLRFEGTIPSYYEIIQNR